MAVGEEENSLLCSSGVFEYQNRPKRDVGWTVAYFIFVVTTVVVGSYGASHRNNEFGKAFSAEYHTDPRHCPYGGRNLLAVDEDPPMDVPDFFRHAAWWLVLSTAFSGVLGLVFLLAFKHAPHFMVRFTIQVQIAVPILMGILSLIYLQPVTGIILLVYAAFVAFLFFLWRNEIELCARLLGVAAVGLHKNPMLVFFVVVAKLCLTLILSPMLVFQGLAYANGQVVPNGAREGSAACTNAQTGETVPCCVWEPQTWVNFYWPFVGVTMLWTIFIIGQLRVFVISGTIAQWYFAPADGPGGTKGMTKRSLKHALGASFGSLAFGAAILTLIQLARSALQKARQNARQGNAGAVLWSLLSFFLELAFTFIEFLTKFATVMAAITGEGFLAAGRRSTDLLARNFLKSYAVWWFPPLVLQLAAFTLSAAWGVLVYLLYWLANHSRLYGKTEGIIVAAVSWFVSLVVLSFFSSIINNIVDAVYICYAIDKDNQTVTKPDVHEIYSKVPVAAAAAVEQPGGEVQYGAPQNLSPAAPASYVPPSDPSAAHNFHDSSARV